jgi:hypothetical protein
MTMLNTIAERTLTALTRPDVRMVVKLGAPGFDPLEKDYRCEYQIIGTGVSIKRFAAGIDAFQALLLALGMIRAELTHIENELDVHFAFGDLSDSGF